MKYIALAGSALAAILLTGCNEQEEAVVAPADDVALITEDDGYPVGGTLNEQQQESYDTFDREAAVRDYEASRTAMTEDGDDDMAGTGNSGDAQGTASESGNQLRPRSQMDFSFLDRNGDGQLSVGEYAIWAVRANPTEPVANDENRPFISTEQVNEAGQTFFFFDEDGDTYLSPAEFSAARNSAMTP